MNEDSLGLLMFEHVVLLYMDCSRTYKLLLRQAVLQDNLVWYLCSRDTQIYDKSGHGQIASEGVVSCLVLGQ